VHFSLVRYVSAFYYWSLGNVDSFDDHVDNVLRLLLFDLFVSVPVPEVVLGSLGQEFSEVPIVE